MIDFMYALAAVLWPIGVFGAAFFIAMAITPEPKFTSDTQREAIETLQAANTTLWSDNESLRRRIAALESHPVRTTFTPAVMQVPAAEPKLPDPE